MTLTELKALVSYWVDDVNFGYFTEVQVTRFLNQAQREVQKQLIQSGELYYLKCQETTMVADQQDYVVPTDIVMTHRMEIVLSGTAPNENKQAVTPMTLNQQDLLGYSTGTPVAYVYKKNRFALFPIPDTGLTLRIYYSYRVVDMTLDADIPDVPEDYQEYIAVLATIDGFIKDDRNNKNIMEKRDHYVKLLKEAAQIRTADQPRSVVVTGTDFGMLW